MTEKQLKAESKTSESDLHTNREVIQTLFVYMNFLHPQTLSKPHIQVWVTCGY